eukprot:gnl/MRDRNA2_/MRDRNA2_91062_c0_seq1.p1 gnl/MRDRNA2_/MRDRNA2_91062_c0~~gnl/MRDRNA2_/MRDRNA2_91062_c0_seq1.p1  ORF type:complete len:296 (-),score=75.14 gnl/MRDRNA2_/MRDRNA2_91062_c0_seq1:221-1021(-)
MADASKAHRRQLSGAAMAGMLDHRPTACVRNHSRDNMVAIREKERQLRMQRGMEALKMPDKAFKLKQFENVKSRAFDGKPPLPASTDIDKIRAQRRLASLNEPSTNDAGKTPRKRSSSTPPPPIQTDEVEDENVMSMAAFEAEVEQLKAMHASKNQKGNITKDTNGCPKYLQKIKSTIAKEQREAAEKRNGPSIPAGYRIMPKEEVDETLAGLKAKRESLEKEYQKLPFKIETDSQKRREKRILDDIEETDKGIKLFSQPTVIVES